MRKLTSTKYSASAFNLAMLIMRIGFGSLMITKGYNKLVNFATYKKDFMSFLGLGNTFSFGLLVFAEFFCAALVILGLFTRFAAIPIVIAMCVALFKAHKALVFGEGEMAAIYALAFLVIAILGPGKISVDGAMGK